MGSSPFNLLEQNTRSASSFAPMNGSVTSFLSSASDYDATRNKPKSYLNNRQRSKGKRESAKAHASVKDSLAKFLADSKDEDLLLVNTKAKDDDGKGNHDTTNHQNDDDIMSTQSDVLFDRDALSRAGTRRTRIYQPKPRRSMDAMELSSPTGSRERPRRKLEGRRPRRSRNTRESQNKERKESIDNDNEGEGEIGLDGSTDNIHDHEKSASSLGFDDAESCASSVVSKNRQSTSHIQQGKPRTTSLKNNHTDVRRRSTRRVRSADPSEMGTRDHEKSASSLGFDDAESCASSVVSKNRRSTSHMQQGKPRTTSLKDNHTDVRKRTTRRVRSADLSGMGTSGMKRSGTRTRPQRHSLAPGLQDAAMSGVKRKGTKSKRVSSRNLTPSLGAGLQDLDRKNRIDSMKDKYSSAKSADGGESIVSNTSYRSARTSSTAPPKSTYKSSGLEGGALSAFMGNEHIARDGKPGNRSSGGASMVSTPADEQYMRERKAQQDLILDVATKEKLQNEANATLEAERREKQRRGSKKKGFVSKMKQRASNSMLAKASAKEVANALMDPKRVLRKGKRGSSGYKPSESGMGSDANGDFDATKKERTISDKSANIDILFDPDDTGSDDEKILNDYDSRVLSDRQTLKGTFADRLSLIEKSKILENKRTNLKRFSAPPEISVDVDDWKVTKETSDLWGN